MPDIPYRGNLGSNTANTGSQPSPYIWSPLVSIIDEIRRQEREGYQLWETFDKFKASSNVNAAEALWADGWNVFGDNGATVALSNSALVPATGTAPAFGVVTIGSDGDNEGASIRQVQSPFRIVGPNATGASRGPNVALEARVLSSTITTAKHGFFCGLIEDVASSAIIPLTAAGAIADKNMVGFHRPEATDTPTSGDLASAVNCMYKADGVTAVKVLQAAKTMVAATYVKLGMVYTNIDSTLRYYADGVLLSTSSGAATKAIPAAAGTDFPNDINLGFIFSVLNATGTTPGTSAIDWVKGAMWY